MNFVVIELVGNEPVQAKGVETWEEALALAAQIASDCNVSEDRIQAAFVVSAEQQRQLQDAPGELRYDDGCGIYVLHVER